MPILYKRPVLEVQADNLDDYDTARRQADHFGREGIEAKRFQKNWRILKQNGLFLNFRRLETAKACQRRIARICGPTVRTKIRFSWLGTGKPPRLPLPVHRGTGTKH